MAPHWRRCRQQVSPKVGNCLPGHNREGHNLNIRLRSPTCRHLDSSVQFALDLKDDLLRASELFSVAGCRVLHQDMHMCRPSQLGVLLCATVSKGTPASRTHTHIELKQWTLTAEACGELLQGRMCDLQNLRSLGRFGESPCLPSYYTV
jgi:hypothetical protein